MIDIILIASITILTVLLGATSYAAFEYFKQLRKTQIEYEKARNAVEDIVLSFNRELRREVDRIENVSFRVESIAAQAEAGLRKTGSLEEKVMPLEIEVNKVSSELGAMTNLLGSVAESNSRMLEKVTNIDANAIEVKLKSLQVASEEKITKVDSKIQNIETAQAALKSKIAGLEEQLQKTFTTAAAGSDLTMPTPVMPIKRDKAMASLTETEVVVLEFLSEEGPKTAPEIKEKVKLSREHTARLMKKLYEEGYLERETGKLPFRYSVKKEMEKLLRKAEPNVL
ncbi:MAG TPA: MarR family transcriptional regulator [Candidatus Nanoarchaeia archaeon]|nr:MarR family transcriptional regulator [Candidatus Nanoarchaeia archaeon]